MAQNLPERLIVNQMNENFLNMEYDCSLPWSQKHVLGPYAEPGQSVTHIYKPSPRSTQDLDIQKLRLKMFCSEGKDKCKVVPVF